jgi:hypothetical protein
MSTTKWFTSAGAPGTTPGNVGDINTDTTNDKTYISVDTSASSDWKVVPQATSDLTKDDFLKRKLIFRADELKSVSTNGAASGSKEYATNDINVDYWDFDASTEEYVQIFTSLPWDYNGGTVKFKAVWTDGTTAGTGNVIWGFQAMSINDNDAIDTTYGTAAEVTDTFITSGDLHLSDASGAVTIAGTPAALDIISINIYRKAAAAGDTYTQDARLLMIQMEYTRNTTSPAAW